MERPEQKRKNTLTLVGKKKKLWCGSLTVTHFFDIKQMRLVPFIREPGTGDWDPFQVGAGEVGDWWS